MADAVAIFTPGQRLLSASGVPYATCTVTFYNAGSTNPKLVYADSDLQTSLGSVVYTDSAGYPVTAQNGSTKTQVYTTTGTYKIVIADTASGETITHDNCAGAVISGVVADEADTITQAEADIRYTRNANALSVVTTLEDTDLFPFWQISGSGNRGITYANIKAELTTDFRADGRMFPVGTRMVFQQTTPPTGWTKETGAAYDDAALRFETGTIGTGGSASFNTTFASRTFTGTVGSDTPSTTKMAAHGHPYREARSKDAGTNNGGLAIQTGNEANVSAFTGTPAAANGQYIGGTGSGTAHDHTLTMDAANFAVKYVEACVGEKS